jgi:sarcosine dehydrogenase
MNCQLTDVTSSWSVLSLMGPRSRHILEALNPGVTNNFAFGQVRTISLVNSFVSSLVGVDVRALRVTYMGELGWELHVPVESAVTLYRALMDAGARYGLKNAGYRAIESCRLEKGYRAWGSDIGADHTPIEAGLGWAVKLQTDIDFLGRSAVERQRHEGVRKMLTTFTCDPSVVLLGRETIYRDGERVGWLSSGGFGYTVQRSIGMGYVRNPEGVTADWVRSGTYELEVATQRVSATATLAPLYDPTNAKIKA